MESTKLVLKFIWNLFLIICGALAIDFLLHSDNVWIRLTCVLPAYTLMGSLDEMYKIFSNKD